MNLRRAVVGGVRLPGIAWSFGRLGYRQRARRFDARDDDRSLAGTSCLVTGANGGIGFAIGEALARRHADLWLLCRSSERGQQTAEQLQALGTGTIQVAQVDVADFASIDRLLARLRGVPIDRVIHNAGALVHERTTTADGLEATFACHVAGPHRLTCGLLPNLGRAADPRIIYVSSGGMYSQQLCTTELLEPPEPFDGVRAYAQAKRAQVELAQLWAERHPQLPVFAMHPGWADTPGLRTALPRFHRAVRPWLRTPAEAADTAVWLAASSTLPVKTGSFLLDRASARRHLLPGTRATEREREQLWKLLHRLAGQPCATVAE